MSLIKFILANFDTDRQTVLRCIDKATIIIYKNNCLFLSNAKYIYYLGFSKEVSIIDRAMFMLTLRKEANNKLIYMKKNWLPKKYTKLVDSTETVDGRLYKWVC